MKIYIKLVLGLFSIIVLIAANWLYSPKDDQHVHIHAGFKIFINDVEQDYTDYKYMNFVPCTEHDEKKSRKEEQIEKAHLHDAVGDVVHVHRPQAKWSDLFKNAKIELPEGESVKAYLDGKEVTDIMNELIVPYSSVTFVVGESKIDHSQEKVSLEHIKAVESKSELCGTS